MPKFYHALRFSLSEYFVYMSMHVSIRYLKISLGPLDLVFKVYGLEDFIALEIRNVRLVNALWGSLLKNSME